MEPKKLKAAKRAPFMQRPLKIDGKELLKATAKMVLNLATARPMDALTELPEALAAVGLELSDENRAWTLIIRGFERAACDILGDYLASSPSLLDQLSNMNWEQMDPAEVVFEVGSGFFNDPTRDRIINQLIDIFKSWLIAASVPASDISNLANRLPSQFAFGVHNEWASNSAYYDPIREALISPFLPAALEQMEWERYRTFLRANADDRVFEESFSLRQIYIEPRGSSKTKVPVKPKKDDDLFSPDMDNSNVASRVFWITEELKTWISQKDSKSPIRLVSGGPGSGKSSLSRMFAAQLSELSELRTILVPLHQLDTEVPLSRSIGEHLRTAGHFRKNPLEDLSDTLPTVIFLDGLDEIQMQGKAAQDVAQQLISDLIRLVDSANSQFCRLLAVVCGRELAIQSTEGSFKNEGEIIHVLPYFISDPDRSKYIESGLITIDQRDEWWSRYGSLTGQSFEGIPAALTAGELGEVTAQPLLNYLVALSYRRSGITLDSTTNINAIYSDLLNAVYERGWARHNHPAIKGVEISSFKRLLEEVALSVWHGAGRTTTLREVEEHCRQSSISALLPSLQAGAASGVSGLLLAFYFRQKGRRNDGDKTFEFTHKSFGEYLTALRIIRMIDQVVTKIKVHRNNPDDGWTDEDALYQWLLVCGPARIDTYLLAFIVREVATRGRAIAEEWQDGLSSLYGALMRQNWPIQRKHQLRFSEQLKWVRNAEETLLAAVNACARTSRRLSKIKWPQATSFGESLKRIQGQRNGPWNEPLLNCLSYLDASGQCLDMADLYGADLSNSNLSNTELHFAIMSQANLAGTDLRGARFLDTNFREAHLQGARFDDSAFEGGVDRTLLGLTQSEPDLASSKLRLSASRRSKSKKKPSLNDEMYIELRKLGAEVNIGQRSSGRPKTVS